MHVHVTETIQTIHFTYITIIPLQSFEGVYSILMNIFNVYSERPSLVIVTVT